MKRSRAFACLVVLLLAAWSGTAMADTIAVNSVTGATLFSSGSDQLYGWVFHVNTSVDVTALGILDSGTPGLSVAHDVGIFDQTSQTLLTSTTLASGACANSVGGYCFNTLGSAVLLNTGNYVIVMTMPVGNGDTQQAFATSISTASQITYLTSAFDGGSSLAFPNPAYNGSFAQGMVGPNFLFQDAVAPVPEPSSLVLLGSGCLSLVEMFRRKRRA